MKLPPANRVVATIGIIAGAAGAAAPAIAELDTSSVAGVIGGLIVIGGIVDRFLKGSQAHEARQVDPSATFAAHVGPRIPAQTIAASQIAEGTITGGFAGDLEDPEVDDVPLDELPSDEEELAAPPLEDGESEDQTS